MPEHKYYVIEYFDENVNRIVARSMELDIAILLVKSLLERCWDDDTVSYRIVMEKQDEKS